MCVEYGYVLLQRQLLALGIFVQLFPCFCYCVHIPTIDCSNLNKILIHTHSFTQDSAYYVLVYFGVHTSRWEICLFDCVFSVLSMPLYLKSWGSSHFFYAAFILWEEFIDKPNVPYVIFIKQIKAGGYQAPWQFIRQCLTIHA